MNVIRKGKRVKVSSITPCADDPQSDEAGRQRLGQEGTVKYTYDGLDLYSVCVVFEAPDADGHYEMDFSEEELEVIP